MNESLITKYRPRDLKQVIGQGPVIAALESALKKGNVHSFLYVGPAGHGKTTLARITAGRVGCKPSDVLEIDAATFTGIDDMRAITEGLKYKPLGEGGKRAIIIDECHALSRQAWTALLKSIEEPPAWVYWMLCTTEVGKVPEPIRQRCLKLELRPVSNNMLAEMLDEIAEKEGLKLGNIIDVCAKEAKGSPRQAISNLALCQNAKDRSEALDLLESASESSEAIDLARLLIKNARWSAIVDVIRKLKDTNPESVRQVVRAYLTTALLGAKDDKTAMRLLFMLEQFEKPFNGADQMSPVLLAAGRIIFD